MYSSAPLSEMYRQTPTFLVSPQLLYLAHLYLTAAGRKSQPATLVSNHYLARLANGHPGGGEVARSRHTLSNHNKLTPNVAVEKLAARNLITATTVTWLTACRNCDTSSHANITLTLRDVLPFCCEEVIQVRSRWLTLSKACGSTAPRWLPPCRWCFRRCSSDSFTRSGTNITRRWIATTAETHVGTLCSRVSGVSKEQYGHPRFLSDPE